MNNPSEAVRDDLERLRQFIAGERNKVGDYWHSQMAEMWRGRLADTIERLTAEVEGLRSKYRELESMYLKQGLNYNACGAKLAACEADSARLDYIERTFSGMTNRERYLPVRMIWGKGANGRTLREACDKYMNRDAAMQEVGRG